MTIIYLALGWFAGLWLAKESGLDLIFWLIGTAVAILAALILHRQPQPRLILACLAAFCLGGARYTTAVPQLDEQHVAFYNNQDSVILTGVVVDEPDVRDRSVNLRLRVEQIILPDGSIQPVDGLVLVNTPRYPVVAYGARIRVTGRLETPPQNPEFSYRDYLARQGVHSLMTWPRLLVLEEGQGHALYTAVFAFKAQAQATIQRTIPDPQGALLSAVLLGAREGMPPGLIDDFRTAGLSHLIVVSGFHVSILVAVLAAVTTPLLGQRRAVWAAMIVLVLYTMMVGAGPSVVRAAIMGSVYLVSTRLMGRPTFAPAALFTAGMVMTAVHPFILWEVGFQLSFTATLGIMLYAERFSQWTWGKLAQSAGPVTADRVMDFFGEVVLVSLAAQILTLPLILAYFGQLSLISLPANALVLPVQPAVMSLGGLATLAGMVWPALGQLLGWLAWLFLTYTVVMVRALAALPGAAVPFHLSTTGVIAIYGVILAATALAWQRPSERAELWQRLGQNLNQRLALTSSGLAALLVLSWGFTQPDGHLHVSFFDVDEGEAIFIQTPNGRQLLVDGGLYPTLLYDQLGRQMPFWDRQLDLVIATNPGAGHVAALPGLFQRYRVDRLIVDGRPDGSSVYEELMIAADKANTAVHYALAGELIALDEGVTLEILNPAGHLNPADRQDNSVVVRLVYGDFSLLLTGSLGMAGEEALLAQPRPLQSLVLKAGRNGSNLATSPAFLEAVQPQIMVISTGRDNRFGHPHPETLESAAAVGTAVLRTDELGAIDVVTDGQTMWWQARQK